MDRRICSAAFLFLCVSGCGGSDSGPGTQPAGESRSPKTAALETGAAAIQDVTPVKQIAVYLVGFHPMKNNPGMQMEAHHYCNQVNEDFAQCVLFDGNTKTANLIGIEYIISGKLFDSLPPEEKTYWHPHNYEILSGQLVAPGLPGPAEKELMRQKMNSYGKTWHVWMTDSGAKLPLGDPHLAWSFNRDGEMRPGMAQDRDRRMSISTEEKRRERDDLAALAQPQSGVDALLGKFGRQTQSVRGVQDSAKAR